MERETIGQVPESELVALAERARDLSARLLRVHEGDHEAVRRACRAVEGALDELATIASDANTPRILGATEPAQTRPYYFPGNLEPRVHVAHPWMTAEPVEGGRVGRVRFELIHEGPPGCVHGGFIAWFFDQAFGQHVVASAIGGPTHRLEVTFRRPTPILRELDYALSTERVEGRKYFANAQLRDGDVVLAEAAALFVEPRNGFAPPSDAPAD